jgi:hypothetical protein
MQTTMNTIATKPKTAFTQMVERLYAEKQQSIGNQGTLASVIGTCFASMSFEQNPWKRAAFRDLLLHMEAQGSYAVLRDEVYITVLANIATFGNKMVRGISAWEKKSIVAEIQISELIKHCFAQYEVPEFLESVFYYENKIHMLWYVQLGRGESVLGLSGFPVRFTKKMAHEFKDAPVNFSVPQAIRWAQAKGYGASKDMAETLAWSDLPESFEREVFWVTVIQFFAKHETLPYAKVQEVLFYIKETFEADKNFAMKGRTWEALVKQSDEWHVEYHRKLAALNRAEWNPSGVNSFRKSVVTESEAIEYEIVELMNSEALYDEGYEMNHCVADYEYECIEGSAAIFSLRKKQAETETTLATIEVCLETKTIVQAKAKYNECISLEAENLMVEWAKKEALELDYEEYYAHDHVPQAAPIALPAAIAAEPAPRPIVYNAPQNNYRAERNTDASDVNWKFILYIAFMLVKACALLAR